jgi:hypothetical protein
VDIFEGFLKKKITCTVFVTIVLKLVEKQVLMFISDKTIVDFLPLCWKLNISNFIRDLRTKTQSILCNLKPNISSTHGPKCCNIGQQEKRS